MTEERHNLIFINLKTLSYVRDKFWAELLYEDRQQRNKHQVDLPEGNSGWGP